MYYLFLSLSFTQPWFPSIVFADFFLMNLILWVEGSSAAIPFGTLVAILALWFGISVPLTFVGAYFGFKKAVSWASQFINLSNLILSMKRLSSFLFSFCSRAGNWATSANKSDPPSNSRAVILHKAYSWYSNGRDTALRLHLHPAFLHSQQHLVRRQECCLSRLVCNSGFALCYSKADVSLRFALSLSGLIRCTTCLDSFSWFSLFYSSPALRQQFSSVTSTYVLRYFNVHGILSHLSNLIVEKKEFTFKINSLLTAYTRIVIL